MRKDEEFSKAMKRILDAPQTARTTIRMLLCDCKTEEIAWALFKYNSIAGYHQKTVMMRSELARRCPEIRNRQGSNIPIEDRILWEKVCEPFRKLKQERERRERIANNSEGIKIGLDKRPVQNV